MRVTSLCTSFLLFAFVACAQNEWKAVPGKLQTEWAAQVDAAKPHPEYPRPQLVRHNNWMNLNGLWNYAITPKSNDQKPQRFEGNILVPFAVESSLSGVGKTVGKDSLLWYERTVSLPASFKKGKVLMHFGAVDWQCEVFVNGRSVGSHEGGYDPFSMDITNAIKGSGAQKITVRVWDPSDDGPQPRGKQVKNPHSIWYTPVTGIWQTVWLESVPAAYIQNTRNTPDADAKTITVQADVAGAQSGDVINVAAFDGSNKIGESKGSAGESITISVPNAQLWSPDAPKLYDLKITLLRKGKRLDEAASYFALRKISMAADAGGIQRMLLNNQFLFQYGPLDQGWWPDGLYTAPTDEALKYDIVQTKAMGFNMIRKHVKTEPARWYRYCDSIGILVWQDMPSGDMGNGWQMHPGIFGGASDKDRTPESEAIYRKEWKEIMDDLYNFPSIVVWVPFNEAWGQFKTADITNWTMNHDKSRLVNSASGGNFEPVGHILDIHNYPAPVMPHPDYFGKNRILVLGEFGGLGLPLEGHTWQDKNNWGYQSFKSREELQKRYTEFINRIPDFIQKGLSAAVYTQTTDVEIETNGLMTYDRKEMKMPAGVLKTLHQQLYNTGLVKLP